MGETVERVIREEKTKEEVLPIDCPDNIIVHRPSIAPKIGGGKFNSDPIVSLHSTDRSLTLIKDLKYVQTNGLEWAVPAGTISDGASIPKIFWSFIGGPLDGPYRSGAIIHDYYCDVRSRTWQDTHLVFLDAMLCNGTARADALKMYYAVYGFGPRWNIQTICNTRRAFIVKEVQYYVRGSYMTPTLKKTEEWTPPVVENVVRTDLLPPRPISAHRIRTDFSLIDSHDLTYNDIEQLADRA
jgi:hypothetical protein